MRRKCPHFSLHFFHNCFWETLCQCCKSTMVEACQVTTAAMSAESRKLTLGHPPPTAAMTAALAAAHYFPSVVRHYRMYFFRHLCRRRSSLYFSPAIRCLVMMAAAHSSNNLPRRKRSVEFSWKKEGDLFSINWKKAEARRRNIAQNDTTDLPHIRKRKSCTFILCAYTTYFFVI